MNVVTANLLANYKEEVVVVTSNGKTIVRRNSKDDDLEEQLVALLSKTHSEYMIYSGTRSNCL